jgi:CBS domain-containing protein
VTVADDLAAIGVSDLDLRRYVPVDSSKTVTETVDAMRDAGHSCACVVHDGALVGVFTQRDVLMRVLGRPRVCDLQINEEMTRSPRTMRVDQSVADGLAIMRDWWVRNVPVVDDGHLVGNLSWYTVMQAMARVIDRPPSGEQLEPGVEHGLAFVDFTGLNTSTPVMLSEQDAADVAVHHMRARAIGSLLVVDGRGHLVGILTEFDLLMHLACTGVELEEVSVKEMMTSDVVSLSARSSIADAIQQMADRGFSHAPLLGESSRPVGIASFRDIASYFETSLESFS